MTIPDFQSLMRPLLELHLDGQAHRNRDLIDALAQRFEVTDEERRVMLPSGAARMLDNRVGWAKTHLTHAGTLESPKRGYSMITDRGRQLLSEHQGRIDLSVLDSIDEHRDWRAKGKGDEDIETDGTPTTLGPGETNDKTPEEELESALAALRAETEGELLELVKSENPELLEQLVVDLLVRMGYGGSRHDAGQAIGKSGDEGIDGVIKEDPLGLEQIFVQAKRWQGSVGRPEIQKFAGALQGQRARKGIFITTSTFTAEAREYVARIESKIILIDGKQLAALMYEHGIGVSTSTTYELKRIDSDYFTGA